MARGFTCKYCNHKHAAEDRNGWDSKQAVCHSCMDEVRHLAREWEEEWAAYSDDEKAMFFAAADEMGK